MTTKLEILNRIVTNCQYEKVKINGKKTVLDGTTASAILSVYKALNDEQKEKFINLEWQKMINITWKLIK